MLWARGEVAGCLKLAVTSFRIVSSYFWTRVISIEVGDVFLRDPSIHNQLRGSYYF